MKAIQIQEFGGPEVFQYVDLDDPVPGEGQVVVDVARCGVNFADTHSVRDEYLAKQTLPLVPGAEISGRTADGRRVASLLGSGGYAQKVAVPEALLVPLPEEIDDDTAAAVLLQGLTAMALVQRCAQIQPGETILIEAAAGGTGSLSVQLAKRAGAKVIGLASTPEKRAFVEGLGADASVDSGADDLGAAIREANGGERVNAVLHMSGASFEAEMGVLAPLGRMVVFGSASRDYSEVSTAALMHASVSVIGFWLAQLLVRPDLVAPMVGELLGAVAGGELEVTIGGVYPLSEAGRAHEDLVARRTSGKLLLDPSK
jgi:NADPH:quinone reductase